MSVGLNGVDKQGIGINGVQVKQTLSAANSTVNKGVYDATLLETVDADLATANIKDSVNIFGKVGPNTVEDISTGDLTVAEAPTGKKFFAVSGGVKTGTGTKTLSNANETVAAGYYAATTLSAVDGDLAVGNIKNGVTIFGFLGTYAGTPAEDILGSASTAITDSAAGSQYKASSIAASSDLTLATLTQNYAANSRAIATGFQNGAASLANTIKLRIFMDGVQVTESAYVSDVHGNHIVMGSAALSGSKVCYFSAHNYDAGAARILWTGSYAAGVVAAMISVGSVKIT
jgi:hypothetical protein